MGDFYPGDTGEGLKDDQYHNFSSVTLEQICNELSATLWRTRLSRLHFSLQPKSGSATKSDECQTFASGLPLVPRSVTVLRAHPTM